MQSIRILRQWLKFRLNSRARFSAIDSDRWRQQPPKHCIEPLEIRRLLAATPVGLTATAQSTGIELNWSTSPPGLFDVYRGSYSTGESATPLASNVSANAFLDPNADLVAGHDYYYTVTAVSGSTQSPFSNEAFAYAPGAYDAPTVDFSNGFPASASSQFTGPTAVYKSSYSSATSVTIDGGSLQYNSPVNTRQFNTQFQVESPVGGETVLLSLQLQSASGKTVTIFDGTQFNFFSTFGMAPGPDFLVQLSYSQLLSQGVITTYVTNAGEGMSNSQTINLAAALGSGTAYAKFAVNANGADPTLDNWFYANSFLLPPPNPVISASAGGIALQFPSTYLGENSQANFGGPSMARIFRGTAPGQQSLTAIGTVALGSTFVDTTAVPGQTYYYIADGGEGVGGPVIGVSGFYIIDGGSGASTAEVSATIPGIQQPLQLTGAPIGTAATWDGTGTIAKVFDGNLNTFFDPANGNLTNWVGLDLGKVSTITQIKYAPRAGYEFRMLDGQFQASSTADFSSNVQTLYTITTTPVAGQLTTVSVNPSGGYRYIRYVGGLQWVNIAEMQVLGLQAPPPLTTVAYAGNPIGTPGGWTSTSTAAAAFDGNLNTFFDPASGSLSDWAGLDLVAPVTITQISYAPRAGYEFRMVGDSFRSPARLIFRPMCIRFTPSPPLQLPGC